MKCAFLFDADHFNRDYGTPILSCVFNTILECPTAHVSSKIFIGDLPLYQSACQPSKKEGGRCTYTFDPELFSHLLAAMLCPEIPIWRAVTKEQINILKSHNIFVVCFESINAGFASYLNDAFTCYEFYTGALQVDDAEAVHWLLFTNALLPKFRIKNKNIYLFYNQYEPDSLDEGMLEWLKGFGFQSAESESLNGRYTIFDQYHDYEHAKRVAQWKTSGGDLLAFIADDVVSTLSDPAPDIGDRLWSIIKAFQDAETDEQLSQSCLSCRRLLDYVTDQLFPPSEEKRNGHSVGKGNMKNRLLAFADEERKSDASIDVICASTEMLDAQIDKLIKLQNKGVHSHIYRQEARRCIIRTILLLDDMMSLKKEPFEIEPQLHFDDLLRSL